MKFFSLTFVLSVVTYAYGYYPVYDLDEAPTLFAQFAKDYYRYYKDLYDVAIHYDAFKHSLALINKMNNLHHHPGDAWFDINEFADYTEEELKKTRGLLPLKNYKREEPIN